MRVTDIQQTYYPFYNFKGKKHSITPTVAVVFAIEDDSADSAGPGRHTVVTAWDPLKKRILTWCGDKLLEGRLAADELSARMDVFQPNKLAASAISIWHASAKLHNRVDAECDFWARHNKGETCEHVDFVMAKDLEEPAVAMIHALRERGVAGEDDAMALELLPAKIIDGLRESWGLPALSAGHGHGDAEDENGEAAPAWYQTPAGMVDKLAFRSPILLEGEKSAGKTTLARTLAESREAPLILVQGNESLEAGDLLGHFVPTAEGLVWKDGKLSQAFRMAAAGRKVVLLLDELLRIPQRQLSVLLGALAPYKGQYSLSTGRMAAVVDGVGVEETLHCPVENLAVVATTNVGLQYAVDDIDPALADRFVPVRMDISKQMAQAALKEACEQKGFSSVVAKKLTTFLEKAIELRDNRQLSDCPTLRVLARCVAAADVEADVAHLLRAHHLLWVARGTNGEPDEQEMDTLGKLTNRIFKGKGSE